MIMFMIRQKVIALSAALSLFAAGCATAQEKPTTQTLPTLPTNPTHAPAGTPPTGGGKPTTPPKFTKDRGVSFKVNEQGAMIPVAANGTPFATCGTLDDNSCSLFKKGITINKMERINITKIEHQINPTCLLYIITYANIDYVWFDKTDPNCAKFNN